jgi:hypothetical protein
MRARPLAMADASSACELDPVGGKVAHAVPIAWTPTEVNRLVQPEASSPPICRGLASELASDKLY